MIRRPSGRTASIGWPTMKRFVSYRFNNFHHVGSKGAVMEFLAIPLRIEAVTLVGGRFVFCVGRTKTQQKTQKLNFPHTDEPHGCSKIASWQLKRQTEIHLFFLVWDWYITVKIQLILLEIPRSRNNPNKHAIFLPVFAPFLKKVKMFCLRPEKN